ncbi:MAG TPA: hypothetical protein VN026_01655 [Bacteroidia bacterium]|jgi:hypothetical protein|nr:hypothetical protein [Bacteroidia bacterium]
MELKISQSLLKGLLEYRGGESCGLVFKAKYIDGRYDLFPPSDVQNVGAWFEYKATGSIPKNGAIPEPVYLSRKKDVSGNPELGADYRLMEKHVAHFKRTMDTYGFKILEVGKDIKARYHIDDDVRQGIVHKLSKLYPDIENVMDNLVVTLTGTEDIRVIGLKDVTAKDSNGFSQVVLKEGQEAIIDLKASGLLSDKFNPYGWSLDRLHEKVKLVTQPIQYKFIEILNTGRNLPFLFLLFHQKNENDCRIIDFRCDETSFEEHKSFINNAIMNLLYYQKVGYEARPTMDRCAECPLKNDCKYKAEVPPIDIFYYSSQP